MKAILTTDTELRAVLEQGYELKAGEKFCLAYSPEREDQETLTVQSLESPK
jgi:UDP-N-acetyl-D-mannosaminuronate dehydrogenase